MKTDTEEGGCQDKFCLEMLINTSCFLCLSSQDTIKCGNCQKVFTCKQPVKHHRSRSGACYPFRVQYDCEMGRYMVDTLKIKPGEVTIHEDPLVLRPYTRSKPQCLNRDQGQSIVANAFPGNKIKAMSNALLLKQKSNLYCQDQSKNN